MALSVSQIASSSYNAVRAEARKATNQWAEAAALRELEKQGMIVRQSLGPQIEVPLDYQANPSAGFISQPLQQVATSETEVVSEALYDIAELSAAVTWSKRTEASNPSENQKISLVKQLLTNGFDSHDNVIETALFAAAATSGFLSIPVLTPDTGQSSVGGIDSTTETMWRSQNSTYVDDTDIEAAFTSVWNACTKGSGSALSPTVMFSDAATQALFEGTQQALQRYENTSDMTAGFKVLMFKTARYVFSKNASTKVYFANPKSLQIVASKEYFRDKSETQELVQQGQAGSRFLIYSYLQLLTNNRSRLGVAHT